MKFTKEQLSNESSKLWSCPFCGGMAEFTTNKSEQLMIEHLPDAGVCCPTRYFQVCDTFEIGYSWWNSRK